MADKIMKTLNGYEIYDEHSRQKIGELESNKANQSALSKEMTERQTADEALSVRVQAMEEQAKQIEQNKTDISSLNSTIANISIPNEIAVLQHGTTIVVGNAVDSTAFMQVDDATLIWGGGL